MFSTEITEQLYRGQNMFAVDIKVPLGYVLTEITEQLCRGQNNFAVDMKVPTNPSPPPPSPPPPPKKKRDHGEDTGR